MNRTTRWVASFVIAAIAAGPLAAGTGGERTLTLQFVPQEATSSTSPSLGKDMLSRPVAVVFEDGRPASEITVVGEGTDDDERTFIWRASNSIKEFTNGVFVRTAEGWGIRIEQEADLVLSIRLTRFFVSEKDQAVGSTYSAEARVAFELKERGGNLLTGGAASATASRYGRKRSADNCNEVLSDAIKEAYASLLDQPALQANWSGGKSPSTSASDSASSSASPSLPTTPSVSPTALLAEVVGLEKQGFSPELLVRYINQRVLTAAMSADDMVEWKNAGLPESVIRAALDRSPTMQQR